MEIAIIAGVAFVAVLLVALPLFRSRPDPQGSPARSERVGDAGTPLSEDPELAAEELVKRARAAIRRCPEHGPCVEPGARYCSQCGRAVSGAA
jgi:hypothetical protein